MPRSFCSGSVAGEAGTEAGDVRDRFEGFVPAEVIDAYDRLLVYDVRPKDRAEGLAGAPGLVAALTGLGMAHVRSPNPTIPAWPLPAAPDLAL
jgi:hypothetical protein